ncbi:hypothetical protein B9479_003823 [Cryptococcus floricola]|uniref:BTB domain-containing protein n=1 Tax=Cryptococcus floricola TaxID=2591691 RepID=A0A5D3AVJ0_9TREE|nr:hypothetical protein B9479_003823 [Cryptococcus floricola]
MGDDKTKIKVHTGWKHEVTNPSGDTNLIATTVELVSSDEVHFHVPRYLLMANSPVLKDMLSLPTGESQKVELSDPFFETFSPIAFYLSLIIGEDGKTTLEARFKGAIVKTCYAAIQLAIKWESVLVLKSIEATLLAFNIPSNLKGHPEVRALDIFLLGYKGDMTNVTATVIQTYNVA